MLIFFLSSGQFINKMSFGPILFWQNYPEDPVGETWVGSFVFSFRYSCNIYICIYIYIYILQKYMVATISLGMWVADQMRYNL